MALKKRDEKTLQCASSILCILCFTRIKNSFDLKTSVRGREIELRIGKLNKNLKYDWGKSFRELGIQNEMLFLIKYVSL